MSSSSSAETDTSGDIPSFATSTVKESLSDYPSSRLAEAAKQLLCGGIAGSVAKTITAPLSRLTILFQVHSLVTTKEHRPRFAMSMIGGVEKIIERGGILSMWKGNMTSVLHRFPYSAINFFVYEHTLDYLTQQSAQAASLAAGPADHLQSQPLTRRITRPIERNETRDQLLSRVTHSRLARRISNFIIPEVEQENPPLTIPNQNLPVNGNDSTQAIHKLIAGAAAGTAACLACYPLDLVRTRLTTELEGQEHYRGIVDAFRKIYAAEGIFGFYSGVGATLCVAVPNFAISYTVYGTLKEYALDDELFYNLRRIDSGSGEEKLGFGLTVLCGASSGILAALVTFPMDTIRRRMQIQNLHVPVEERLQSRQQLQRLVMKEGLGSLYRGLTPELIKTIPMVGTMFVVYEYTKDFLDV